MKTEQTIQKDLFKDSHNNYLTIQEASKWATSYLNRKIVDSNISYLIQYGKVKKIQKNNTVYVAKEDLIKYYESYHGKRELNWKNKLGNDLNWNLSFDNIREKDRTKHVHRLHPYKGKFIPQLVEYFLNSETDDFKKQVYFNKGDIILDPFCGSGTTLVQANELGIHAIGIDISAFNALISNVKISNINLFELSMAIQNITRELIKIQKEYKIKEFEQELLSELRDFNNKYFPTPVYRYRVNKEEINERIYGKEKENEFLPIYKKLIKKYGVRLKNKKDMNFLDKWFLYYARNQINLIKYLINKTECNKSIKAVLQVILSRTIRSCRATTHSDLATLKEPQLTTYYCIKHKKICKPIFSITDKWYQYSGDTINRFAAFKTLRTETFQYCLTGDSRNIDIFGEISNIDKDFYNLLTKKSIDGIFSSPPYVGLIDYHEQHAYSYELFKFQRRDEFEIGPLYKGTGKIARESYIEGISNVLLNCKKYLKDNFDIFLVANDKHNIYPLIAEKSGLVIVNTFKRPVLNRTERDKTAYAEFIFHLKGK